MGFNVDFESDLRVTRTPLHGAKEGEEKSLINEKWRYAPYIAERSLWVVALPRNLGQSCYSACSPKLTIRKRGVNSPSPRLSSAGVWGMGHPGSLPDFRLSRL